MSIKGFFTGGRWIGISLAAVVAAVGLQATAAHAADGFQLPMNGSVISGFAVQSDLARTTAGSSAVVIPAARARTSTTSTMARQSVPDRDRAASYRGGELFANSKTAPRGRPAAATRKHRPPDVWAVGRCPPCRSLDSDAALGRNACAGPFN